MNAATGPRIGSLCTGYGGLDDAVHAVLGGETAWHADNDPGASAILAHHWPRTPNLGDITALDFRTVAPVDVLTAGWPCQPSSMAGKRAGTADERWIFDAILNAARDLDPRPRLLVLENVPGLLT
ncbi:DNA cytosine methyltransferase, partial [Embleya sp. NPDC127516]|uniref:DNA cytosine methyltransferase n=1 Tax=Embleya sp. NPDC127516 TaxID=3363990 RepID=UPI003822DE1A